MSSPLSTEMQIGGLILIERLRAAVLALNCDVVSREGVMVMLDTARGEEWLFDAEVVALHDARRIAAEYNVRLPAEEGLAS